jgi:ABC-type branched-subunit amino acid transport system substrate-binding protein
LVSLALTAVLWASPAAAQNRVLIGMSTPLSGTYSAYGQGLQHGAQLAIQHLNASGGIGGSKLELLVLDDGGDPTRSAANTHALAQRGVVALAGYHGARSVEAALAEIASTGLALLGPASSADDLREPPRRGLFHLRAGAYDEMNAVMLHLDTVSLTRYAVIAQTGSLGDAGLQSAEIHVAKLAMRLAATARVNAADGIPAVHKAVRAVCAAQPEAIVLALDADLAREAVLFGRRNGCMGQYVVLSETGAALAGQWVPGSGPHPLAGMLVSQVVPHPSNLSQPLVADYQRAMHANGNASVAASYPSLEGYFAMRVLIEALRACPRDPSRACVMRALSGRALDVPGQRVQFDATQRLARPFVEMTMLDGQGRFRR